MTKELLVGLISAVGFLILVFFSPSFALEVALGCNCGVVGMDASARVSRLLGGFETVMCLLLLSLSVLPSSCYHLHTISSTLHVMFCHNYIIMKCYSYNNNTDTVFKKKN